MDNSIQNISGESSFEERSFGEYSNDENEEIFVITKVNEPEHSKNPVTNMVNDIFIDRQKYNASYAQMSDLAEKLNAVPGNLLEIPTGKNQMKREAKLKYTYEHHIFCDWCKVLFKNGDTCENCGKMTKKRKNNYFIYINMKQQIEHMIQTHSNHIIDYVKRERSSWPICDIYESNIYKKTVECNVGQTILPYTISVDGAKIFNSSKSSLWPIQLTQGYLPPSIRFRRENMLIVGLFCGDAKPDMSTIMLPFAKEMRTLQQNGIFFWHEKELFNLLPVVIFCCCDLPAVAEVQNCKPSATSLIGLYRRNLVPPTDRPIILTPKCI